MSKISKEELNPQLKQVIELIPTAEQQAVWSNSFSGNYSDLAGLPLTFAPAAHSHTWNTITEKPTTFTPSTHTHNWNDIVGRPVIPQSYTLPVATVSVLGGVKVDGTTVTINPTTGAISAAPSTSTVPNATTSVAGIVQLSTSVASSSTSTAATSSAVNSLNNSKADKVQEALTNFSLSNSWVQDTSGALRYFKDTIGMVHLSGSISRSVGASGIIGQLPTGYRPTQTFYIPVSVTTLGTQGFLTLTVQSDGYVAISATTNFISINTSFRAAYAI